MHTRGNLPAATGPGQLALAILTGKQDGLVMTQLERDTAPFEAALDVMLDCIQALADTA